MKSVKIISGLGVGYLGYKVQDPKSWVCSAINEGLKFNMDICDILVLINLIPNTKKQLNSNIHRTVFANLSSPFGVVRSYQYEKMDKLGFAYQDVKYNSDTLSELKILSSSNHGLKLQNIIITVEYNMMNVFIKELQELEKYIRAINIDIDSKTGIKQLQLVIPKSKVPINIKIDHNHKDIIKIAKMSNVSYLIIKNTTTNNEAISIANQLHKLKPIILETSQIDQHQLIALLSYYTLVQFTTPFINNQINGVYNITKHLSTNIDRITLPTSHKSKNIKMFNL